MNEDKSYDLDNIPDDAEVFTGSNFAPINPAQMYQLELRKVELRDNIFYKPDAKDPSKRGQKYNLNFEFAILDQGEWYGRRIWDTTSLAFKPDGKRGPTKLHKIASALTQLTLDKEEVKGIAPDAKSLMTFLKGLEGKQVKVAIENVTKNDKVRTKIVTYYMVDKELPAYESPNDDFGDIEGDGEVEPKASKKKA